MKLKEQELITKTFPFVIYNANGEVKKKEELVLKEIPYNELISLKKQATRMDRNTERIDQDLLNVLVACRMLVEAPFETDDDIQWKQMTQKQKREFVDGLGSTYTTQLWNAIVEMNPELKNINQEHNENLSENL